MAEGAAPAGATRRRSLRKTCCVFLGPQWGDSLWLLWKYGDLLEIYGTY